jgi:putative ABC transport system substrate-binding protein
MRLLGVLMLSTADNAEGRTNIAALRQALMQLRWIEGQNIRIEDRWTGGDVVRARAYAAELVGLSPDVILAYANAQVAALSRETRTIPVVFIGASDPVTSGYAASFARPGGNITGFTLFEQTMTGKRLGILKEIAPAVTRVAIMFNPETATLRGTFYLREFETAAATFAVDRITAPVGNVSDIEASIITLAGKPHGGLIVVPDTFTVANSKVIVTLAARHHVPAIYSQRHFSVTGGLMSYGPDTADTFRRSASYIDRIMRGEKPAELPIQAPTKFELVINLKTAKALGIDVPPTLLARADEVIE